MKFTFHPDARLEYVDAVLFYDDRRGGLGANFLEEFHTSLEMIRISPEMYRIEVTPNIRVFLMTRFPYHIYYRKIDSDSIQILAVAHTHRRPMYWTYRN